MPAKADVDLDLSAIQASLALDMGDVAVDLGLDDIKAAVDLKTDSDVKAAATVKADANVNAGVHLGGEVSTRSTVDLRGDVGVKAHADMGVKADVDAGVKADVDARARLALDEVRAKLGADASVVAALRELAPVFLNLLWKEVPLVRVGMPHRYKLALQLFGLEVASLSFCGESELVTEDNRAGGGSS